MNAERARGGMRLMEECSGVGEIAWRDARYPEIAYTIRRFQGFAPSGLPVPGVHRLEGRLELSRIDSPSALVDTLFTLKLEDGRSLRLICVDADGRVLAEGHGPSSCGCC